MNIRPLWPSLLLYYLRVYLFVCRGITLWYHTFAFSGTNILMWVQSDSIYLDQIAFSVQSFFVFLSNSSDHPSSIWPARFFGGPTHVLYVNTKQSDSIFLVSWRSLSHFLFLFYTKLLQQNKRCRIAYGNNAQYEQGSYVILGCGGPKQK